MKPENLFFKKIKKLNDRAAELCHNTDVYWPFYHSREAKVNECFKRGDGLWELKRKINPHQNGGSTAVFIWRIAPNYCTAGRPSFTTVKIKELFDSSETEKVIHQHNGYEFIWKWDEFCMPTEVVWGLKMGPTYFVLRKDGEILIKEMTKANFIRRYNALSLVRN